MSPEKSAVDLPFEEWPLHDAPIGTFALNLEAETCSLDLDVFFDAGEDARPARIEWEGVIGFTVVMDYDWGQSAHVTIDRQRRGSDGAYVIELHTGDPVRIKAESARLFDLRAV